MENACINLWVIALNGDSMRKREEFAVTLRKKKKQEILNCRRFKLETKQKSAYSQEVEEETGSDLHPSIKDISLSLVKL